MVKVTKLIASEVIAFAAGAIGSIATTANIPAWYNALQKPAFNPPNWVFGPVWTVLYLLMGLSLYLVWTADYKATKKPAFTAFAVQLVLNTLWSLVFFGLQAPWAGAVIIVLLLGSIVLTIKLFYAISRPAAFLLVPYVLWVSFATALNIGVALLN